jgi:hypothetical protein
MTEIGRQAPDPSRSGLKRRIAGMRAIGYAVPPITYEFSLNATQSPSPSPNLSLELY